MSQPATHSRAPARPPDIADELHLDDHLLPTWRDHAFPWFVSFMLHLGLGLLVLFGIFMTKRSLASDDDQVVIIPTAILGDLGTPGGVPAGGPGDDPALDAAQNRIKNLTADGWNQKNTDANISQYLQGSDAGEALAQAIFNGSNGTIGGGTKTGSAGRDAGLIAPFGAAGGAQGGPHSSFYGTGGNAMKIVYILDRSGGMATTFDDLKENAKKSVSRLLPIQSFAIVMCGVLNSDTKGKESYAPPSIVGGGKALLPATSDNRRKVFVAMDDVVAQGQNDDLLQPFADSFKTAFDLKPQLIYFLTDGAFDPALLDTVKKLNSAKRIHINTIAFGGSRKKSDNEAAGVVIWRNQLEQLAQDNGGEFHWVSDEELDAR